MKFFDHLTDAELHSFVTTQRGISIRKDIWRHRWLLFRVYFGLSRHATISDEAWIREWITRLQGVKHYRTPEHSITAHITNKTPACLN